MSSISMPRRLRPPALVPITPLVDILLILLIFFMVTSTYLDLDMIPMAERGEAQAASDPAAAADGAILIRLDSEGHAVSGGRRLGRAALASEIRARLARHPEAPVLVLPSPRAPLQALVDALDALRAGGARRVSVVSFGEAGAP